MPDMIILSWNVRGLGKADKRRRVKEIIMKNRADIVFLQETKKSQISRIWVQSIWGSEDFEYTEVDACGAAGGLLCIWKPSCFRAMSICANREFILMEGVVNGEFPCVFLNLYAPNEVVARRATWATLRRLRASHLRPWCIGGDCNEVTKLEERKGVPRRDRGMADFNQFIEEMELVDLPLTGRNYTWAGGDGSNRWSRIDRFLLHPEWLQVCNFKQWGLDRVLSDHCPIVLKQDQRDWGPKPFKFFNAWVKHKGFQKVVMEAWEGGLGVGWAGFILSQKLKMTRNALRSWSKKEFHALKTSMEEAESQIAKLERKAESTNLSSQESDQMLAARKEFWRQSRALEWMWLQKSRLTWTLKGDRNTKFFHLVASGRQRRNFINSVMLNGKEVWEPADIRRGVFDHFSTAFKEEWRDRPTLQLGDLPMLDQEQRDQLIKPFTEEEVWGIISSSDGNKAPGPDGFNFMFYKDCWQIIKGEVMDFFRDFHLNAKLVKGLNSAFVTLIPKVQNPVKLRDFRPISLLGSVYKLLAKVLAKRLAPSLPRLIGKFQSAFVGKRGIQDGILVANEVVNFWKKRRKKGIVIKLDFEKAYDNLNWKFILRMMENMGFPNEWITWMETCITTAKISVLVNGSPTPEFQMEKGVRQGDPLSPFLYIIAAEGLSVLLSRARSRNLISGAALGPLSGDIVHLQFADDTILFCEGEIQEVWVIKRILRAFEIISGLKINYTKSSVCGIGRSDQFLVECNRILRCSSTKLPFNYLGLPLGASPCRYSTWRPVLEKIKARLASWKRKVLSVGGRITLIKAVLGNLPIYYLSIFILPVKVAKEIDKLQRDFLWGGEGAERKMALVSWRAILKHKDKGGLGIKDCRLMNQALLYKWWWRFANERDNLWRMVVCDVNRLGRDVFLPNERRSTRGSPVWQGMVSLQFKDPITFQKFKDQLRIKIENGELTRLWLDIWDTDGQLWCDKFPSIFQIVVDKHQRVASMYQEMGFEEALNLRRPVYSWERGELVNLIESWEERRIQRSEREDKMLFMYTGGGDFSVKSCYNLFQQSSEEEVQQPPICVWRTNCPPKIQVFAWLAWRGRVKSAAFLVQKGIVQSIHAQCLLCEKEIESQDHLLLHCEPVWRVWCEVLQWWDIEWVPPKCLSEVLTWWSSWFRDQNPSNGQSLCGELSPQH